jgi:hypothetical protein
MADLNDLRLNHGSEAAPPPPPQPRWLLIIVGIVLLFALVAIWWYLRRSPDPDGIVSGTEQSLAQADARSLGEPGSAIDLPPLDDSDSLVRDLVRALSEHPIVAAWLTTDQLLRNFVVVVKNIGDGDTPSGHLNMVAPPGRFQTRQQGARSYIDARSHARFDPHASAVSGLDAQGAAQLYATLKPRIDEAYREVAGKEADFDRALQRAIVELLKTPVVEGDALVVPANVGYTYADPALESLSHAQRQLLRMGPRNVRVVQEKLRAIARHLGIDAAALPPERVVKSVQNE